MTSRHVALRNDGLRLGKATSQYEPYRGALRCRSHRLIIVRLCDSARLKSLSNVRRARSIRATLDAQSPSQGWDNCGRNARRIRAGQSPQRSQDFGRRPGNLPRPVKRSAFRANTRTPGPSTSGFPLSGPAFERQVAHPQTNGAQQEILMRLLRDTSDQLVQS